MRSRVRERYDLAEEIVDRLLPLTRPYPPEAEIRMWQQRFDAMIAAKSKAIVIERPKPRISIRAATQNTA